MTKTTSHCHAVSSISVLDKNQGSSPSTALCTLHKSCDMRTLHHRMVHYGGVSSPRNVHHRKVYHCGLFVVGQFINFGLKYFIPWGMRYFSVKIIIPNRGELYIHTCSTLDGRHTS